jgi:hypothetical protein
MDKIIKETNKVLNSIGVVLLTGIILMCIYSVVGLVLNFWNETTFNAALVFTTSIIIGTLSYLLLTIITE